MASPSGVDGAGFLSSVPWRELRRTVVEVGTTETALPTTPLRGRKGVWLWNQTDAQVAIGPTGIAATDEAIIVPRQNVAIPVSDDITIYGRVASGTATVVVWEYR